MNRMNTGKQGSKAGISTENLETLIRDWSNNLNFNQYLNIHFFSSIFLKI